MVTLEVMDPSEVPLDLMADSFRAWFHREPWMEVARCPRCSPPMDFGKEGRYADYGEDGLCPACGSKLEEYWTNARVGSYFWDSVLRPGFQGFVLKDEGKVVAWAWGYGLWTVPGFEDSTPDTYYVDTFGMTKGYGEYMMRLWNFGHIQVIKSGVNYFVLRTHSEAQYIKDYVAEFGYKFLCQSSDEPDREYWEYRR